MKDLMDEKDELLARHNKQMAWSGRCVSDLEAELNWSTWGQRGWLIVLAQAWESWIARMEWNAAVGCKLVRQNSRLKDMVNQLSTLNPTILGCWLPGSLKIMRMMQPLCCIIQLLLLRLLESQPQLTPTPCALMRATVFRLAYNLSVIISYFFTCLW